MIAVICCKLKVEEFVAALKSFDLPKLKKSLQDKDVRAVIDDCIIPSTPPIIARGGPEYVSAIAYAVLRKRTDVVQLLLPYDKIQDSKPYAVVCGRRHGDFGDILKKQQQVVTTANQLNTSLLSFDRSIVNKIWTFLDSPPAANAVWFNESRQETCRMVAVAIGDIDTVRVLLTSKKVVEAINTRDIDNMSALTLAVDKKNTACVQLLLNHGADPTWYNESTNVTCLMKAAANNDIDTVKILLESHLYLPAGKRN